MTNGYSKRIERNFLLIISLIFVLITFYLVKDIFSVLIASLIISYFLYPLYLFYNSKIENKSVSSILTIFTSIIGFFIPLVLLSYFLILNMVKLVVKYKEYIQNPDVLNSVFATFMERVTNSDVLSTIDFSQFVNKLVLFVLDISANFFSSIIKLAIYFVIAMFISYYVLIYNKEILRALNEYLPLSLRKQNTIINNIAKNIKVLFRGYFLTGIIQTIVALAGYLFFGAPNIFIITFLTMITSLIPYLGTPMIWVPVSIYMIITGNSFGGIGLLIYGTFVINLVDNFVRPYLMSDKDTISPPLVFIGFVGGMFAFGLLGIIIGPIIISITSILLKYLKESFENYE